MICGVGLYVLLLCIALYCLRRWFAYTFNNCNAKQKYIEPNLTICCAACWHVDMLTSACWGLKCRLEHTCFCITCAALNKCSHTNLQAPVSVIHQQHTAPVSGVELLRWRAARCIVLLSHLHNRTATCCRSTAWHCLVTH